jgi:capsular exopolysaccharide synthesis family protein
MSHIFDALQRLETERSGATSSVMPAATELLERAERAAATKWHGNGSIDSTEASSSHGTESSSRSGSDSSVVEIIGSLGSSPRFSTADRAQLLNHCQSVKLNADPAGRLVSAGNNDSSAAEAFRLLSVRLRHLRRERPLKKLLITSTIPQEGKSVVSANLACVMSSGATQKVVLLEGDVRRPTLSKVFGLRAHPGLCEWLQGERSLADSLYRLEGAGIWLLPAGSAPVNPLELLESKKLPDLMEQLAAIFDWIIIDSPPVLPIADTSVWSRLADGILLVTRQGVTEKRHLQRGLEALDQGKLIGALLNSSRRTSDNDYYAYRPRETESSSVDQL